MSYPTHATIMSDTPSTPQTLTGQLRALAAAVDAINSVPATTINRAALQIEHLEIESQERMARIVTLERELDGAKARINRLEKAGDALSKDHNPFTFLEWTKAKEDAR